MRDAAHDHAESRAGLALTGACMHDDQALFAVFGFHHAITGSFFLSHLGGVTCRFLF